MGFEVLVLLWEGGWLGWEEDGGGRVGRACFLGGVLDVFLGVEVAGAAAADAPEDVGGHCEGLEVCYGCFRGFC